MPHPENTSFYHVYASYSNGTVTDLSMNMKGNDSKKTINLMPGEYYVTNKDIVISTIVGSCVTVCLYDPVRAIIGMNHFLLSKRQYPRKYRMCLTEAGRYGVYAMELMINDMLMMGADKTNFCAKAFGGASLLPKNVGVGGFASVGETNCRFILEFLKDEGIRLVASDLGGHEGRAIRFHSKDFVVFQRKIKRTITQELVKREELYWKHDARKTYPEPEIWDVHR